MYSVSQFFRVIGFDQRIKVIILDISSNNYPEDEKQFVPLYIYFLFLVITKCDKSILGKKSPIFKIILKLLYVSGSS